MFYVEGVLDFVGKLFFDNVVDFCWVEFDIGGVEYIVCFVEEGDVFCDGVDDVEIIMGLNFGEVVEVGVVVFWFWVGNWEFVVLEGVRNVGEGFDGDEFVRCVVGDFNFWFFVWKKGVVNGNVYV